MDDKPTVVSVGEGAVWARDQFAALMASSHPRCGALSPARSLAPPLARHLWSEWVAGRPAVAPAFVLVVEPEGFRPPGAFSLAVSGTTLGVTRGVEAVRDAPGRARWLGPDLYLESVNVARRFRLVRRVGRDCGTNGGGGGGANEGVPIGQQGRPMDRAVNARWYVNWMRNEAVVPGAPAILSGYSLTICNIHQFGCPSVPMSEDRIDAVTVQWPDSEVPEESKRIFPGVFFNRVLPDEALLVFAYISDDSHHVTYTLIDVGMTHSSRILKVTSSISIAWPTTLRVCSLETVLVMRRKSDNAPLFIMQPLTLFPECCWVYVVDPATWSSRRITETCNNLTQVSDSVFCMDSTVTGSYELWDCNNTEQPLRTVQNSDSFFDHVVGGRGFLFAVKGRQFTVIEASTGFVVMTFLVGTRDPSSVFSIAPTLSFLE